MGSARTFESIVIIFNPNSTGNAPELAEELHGKLIKMLPYSPEIILEPTQHAGHAVDLARLDPPSLVAALNDDGEVVAKQTFEGS